MAEGCQKCFCVTLDKSNRTENGKILEIGGNKMQRTISAMVGKGSVNHNSRKFKAENVDGERSHWTIVNKVDRKNRKIK